MKSLRALAVALLLAVPAVPAWPVIDCSKARTNAEKMLCSNPRLMQADEQMALAYRGAIRRGADPEQLIESQRAWIRDARDACNDAECLMRAYLDRIGDLEGR